ncbi:B12-binding domain-containing radical SAM protein [Spirochaetota bacterium]
MALHQKRSANNMAPSLKIFITTPGNENICIQNNRIVRYKNEMSPFAHSNTALGILKNRLKAHRVKVLDSWTWELSNDEIMNEIREFSPHIVGISSTTTREDMEYTFDLCSRIKKHDPTVIILIGKYLATLMPECCLRNPNVDFILMGECERTLPLFADIVHETMLKTNKNNIHKTEKINKIKNSGLYISSYMKRDISLRKIKGIGFRIRNKLFINEKLDTIDSKLLDNLHLYKVSTYRPIVENKVFIPLTSSRGCSGRCLFCDITHFSKKIRYENPETTVRKMIKRESNIFQSCFFFFDDNFTTYPKRADRILSAIQKHKYISVGFLARIHDLLKKENREMLSRFRDCIADISMGLENTSTAVLKRWHKNISLQAVLDVHSFCKKNSIGHHFYFILGDPDTDKAELNENIENLFSPRTILKDTWAYLHSDGLEKRLIITSGSKISDIFGDRAYTKPFLLFEKTMQLLNIPSVSIFFDDSSYYYAGKYLSRRDCSMLENKTRTFFFGVLKYHLGLYCNDLAYIETGRRTLAHLFPDRNAFACADDPQKAITFIKKYIYRFIEQHGKKNYYYYRSCYSQIKQTKQILHEGLRIEKKNKLKYIFFHTTLIKAYVHKNNIKKLCSLLTDIKKRSLLEIFFRNNEELFRDLYIFLASHAGSTYPVLNDTMHLLTLFTSPYLYDILAYYFYKKAQYSRAYYYALKALKINYNSVSSLRIAYRIAQNKEKMRSREYFHRRIVYGKKKSKILVANIKKYKKEEELLLL